MMVNKGNMPARDNDTGRALASATPGSMGENPGSGGNSGMALIHPQRHNLKNRFELLRTLGEGTYGKVKLACEKATGEQVAIKYVKKTKIRDEMDLKRIRREIRILSTLRHPHIINIRQVFEKKDRIVLVMDCALGGELYDHLNTHRHIPEPNTRRLFRQIASAVHYMHQNSIVHRDLKLENIILDSEGDVKIADFGLANYFSYDRTLDTFCGSPLYASPEIVNGKPYHGPEVDVWSLGVVLYTLAYGAMPFESSNLKVLRQQISDGLYAEPAQPCGAAGLIRHMLTVTPARRATVQDVLNHWWVNLGHELTPDGQRYEPVPHPTGRTSHCSQSSFSCDSEVGGGYHA
ncbi:NUAK SNF1-like kinase 1 [Nucella lapillus]